MRSSREGPMRVFVMAVAGLMVAAGAQAQQSTPAQQKAQALQNLQKMVKDAQAARVARACPGVLSARQQSAVTMWTVSREDAKDTSFAKKRGGSGIHVDLKSSRGALREIELSVSYIAPGARVMTVAPDEKDVREKTFDLSVDGLTDVDRDLLVGPAFQITRVHLISATYADGQVWNATSEDACSIAPDRLLLVADK